MHDFRCAKAEDMLYPLLPDKAETLKGNRNGGVKMSVIDEIELDAETRTSENIAVNLIKAGKLALEETAKICSLTLQRVQELAKTAS